MAEAWGFEPWLDRRPTISFQDPLLQPLGYAPGVSWSIGSPYAEKRGSSANDGMPRTLSSRGELE